MNIEFNIFLVGPMGAGKSSIGRKLAKKLRLPFWDSDKEIERRTGVDIPTIFEFEGEEGFREREATVIDELTARQGIVMATGGGAIIRADNRERLRSRGMVIYLQTSIKQQFRRTARDRNRPILAQAHDPRVALQRLMERRAPLYEDVADSVVSTDRHSIAQIIEIIVANVADHNATTPAPSGC